MSRPDDIPQDVWDAAERPSLRVQLDSVAQQTWDIRPTIARAIMAAKAEERRSIQTEIQDMAVPAAFSNSWQLGYRQCRIDAVAAIRKRGEN